MRNVSPTMTQTDIDFNSGAIIFLRTECVDVERRMCGVCSFIAHLHDMECVLYKCTMYKFSLISHSTGSHLRMENITKQFFGKIDSIMHKRKMTGTFQITCKLKLVLRRSALQFSWEHTHCVVRTDFDFFASEYQIEK